MTCKPTSWYQVDDNFIDIKSGVLTYLVDELLGDNAHISAAFRVKTPQIFILVKGNKKYIVDTQGYNYIRYIQRIK